jgi:type IV pilus assembly protein PilY1
MTTNQASKNIAQTLAFIAVTALGCGWGNVQGAVTDISNAPMVTSTTTEVLPNLMFVLDDSGSMGWAHMPDDAQNFAGSGYASNQCNGVYYDPGITYKPPVYSSGASYADATFTGAWVNGYNTSAGTTNLNTSFLDLGAFNPTDASGYSAQNAFYYQYSGTQTTAALKDYYNTSSTFYRECDSNFNAPSITVSGSGSTSASSIKIAGIELMSAASTASTSTSTVASNIAARINQNGYSASASGSTVTISGPFLQAAPVIAQSGGMTLTPSLRFSKVRLSPTETTTITISTASSASVDSIKVNGVEISGFTTGTPSVAAGTNTSTTAGNISAGIYASKAGCSATTSSTNVITVTCPTSMAGYAPAVHLASGTMSFTTNVFPDTDTTHMQNFANWYSYYRYRMLMMKTAAGIAFKPVDEKFRVGYMTINNNNNYDILNFAPFDTAARSAWYTKLYAATPNNSTPLRQALANVGRIYAHKLTSLYSTTITDPVQYSCQQNFTILSTDGFWRSDSAVQLNGSSAIGNQDGLEPRPYNDGGSVTYDKSTSRIDKSQTQVSKSTSQLLSRTTQLQSSTSTLQKQISQLRQDVGTLQKQTSQLQSSTSHLQSSTMYLQKRTSSDSGSTWSAWSGIASCTWDTSSSSRAQCRYVTTSGGSTVWSAGAASWANVSSCTTSFSSVTSGGTVWSGNGTSCQYTAYGTPTDVSSCTTVAQDTTSPYDMTASGGVATQCQYVVPGTSTAGWSVWANAGSCSAVAQDTTSPYNMAATTGLATQCQYAWTTGQSTPSCSTPAYVAGNYSNVTVYNNCAPAVTSGYATATSCTATTTPDGSGYTNQCQYTAWTSYANASSCTDTPQSTGATWSGPAMRCQTLYNSPTDTIDGHVSGSVLVGGVYYVPAGSCTPSGPTNGRTVTCPDPLTTGPTFVAACPCSGSACNASSGNQWTQTTCNTDTLLSPTAVSSCTPAAASAANGYVNTICTLVSNTTTGASCTATSPSLSNNWTTTTCSAGTATGGTPNTLADVAEYYYATDLRTTALGNATGALGTDITTNNVPKSGLDGASWQHMTTFTLGLGARGRMVFDPSYKTQTAISFSPADFYSISQGSPADSATGVCSWQTVAGLPCNWPVPGDNQIENVDDLWHAAVNGRGTYFSATNPASLSTSLSDALSGVSAITGASASATTSSPNVTAGDNFVFSSTFTTQEWDGELVRQQLDLDTGAISSSVDWSAQAHLDNAISRTVYTYDPTGAHSTGGSKVMPFVYGYLPPAAQAYFNEPNISTSPPSGTGLSQFLCLTTDTCLSTPDKALAAGDNLVYFLRGDRSNEGSLIDNTKYYRQRAHLLGDTVDAEAVYVKTSYFSYTDSAYSDFVAANSARVGMVYIAANDGMLHAFKAGENTLAAGDGEEQWAYVPALVLPELYKLADKNYQVKHRYFVDGTPAQGDAYFNSEWHTILVGGLNAGGRGYYALDITDPAAPKALWEFTDTNLGYTYGNPIIAKLKDGTWVVLVTSGYNNVSPGDGMGHLYVLNAATGEVIRNISTGVGSSGTPSGLGRINAYVVSGVYDNTLLQVYGGDMLGNLWRFDVNGDVGASGFDAQLLATLRGPSGNVQPITSRPEMGIVNADNGKNLVIYVGTGRYLGTSDLADTSQQTIYGIKDPMSTGTNPATAIYYNPRSAGGFIQQTLTSTTCPADSPSTVCTTGQAVRTSTNNEVDFASNDGWFVDLVLDSGERANTDPTLQLGVLGFTTNVPSESACTIGGYSFRYFFDYRTGGPLTSLTMPNTVVSTALGNALATRPVYIELPNGDVIELTTLSGSVAGGGIGGAAGNIASNYVPKITGSGSSRRTSWRELTTE